MKSMKCFLIIAVVFCLAGIVHADKADDVAKENQELKQRLDKMEKQLNKLLKKQTSSKPAYSMPDTLDKDSVDKLLKLADGKKPITSSLDIDVYGKIKLDASLDSDRTTAGNYVRWVDSQATKKDDDEMNITARETRLGFNVSGPEKNGMKTSGKVEVDFYGGTTENKNEMYMRHAYMKLDWPADQFSIIAGQTWDVISPLNPSTLNYSVMWWQGNIQYRRPQIRLTKGFDLSDDVHLKLAGAVARTIGDSLFMGSSFVDDSGADSGKPTVQGRAGLTFPLLGYKPTTLGVSGHWGEEEFDTDNTGRYTDLDTWSVNFDLVQPINEWLTIKGELFHGENLDAYLGGIGQGVNATTGKAIASKGGWVSAAIKPWDNYKMNVGIGIDDPDDQDLNSGDRSYNSNIFGNIIYAINDNTDVGLELSQQKTKYKDQDDADNFRAQLSFIYKF